MFHWSWTPFVDPDFMLSVFQCNQIAQDPADPTNYYNDANWCRSRSTTSSTSSRRSSSTRRSGASSCTEMLTPLLPLRGLQQPRPEPGSRGVSHRPLRGLAPAAGGGRARDLHQHLADVLQPDADRRRRRLGRAACRARRSAHSSLPALIALGGARVRAHATSHGRRARVEASLERDTAVGAALRRGQGPRRARDAGVRPLLQLLPLPRRRGRPGRDAVSRAQPHARPARAAAQRLRSRRIAVRAVRRATSSRPCS